MCDMIEEKTITIKGMDYIVSSDGKVIVLVTTERLIITKKFLNV